MAVYNAYSGLRRRLPKHHLNWKIRSSHSSTVSARMYGREAMEAFHRCTHSLKKSMKAAAAVHSVQRQGKSLSTNLSSLVAFLLLSSALFYKKAIRMLQLESDLLDIPADVEANHNERFHKELVGITLDSYLDDNECIVKTRFTKDQIRNIIEALDLPTEVKVCYRPNAYFKFLLETLFIYMVRKMSTSRTHQDMTVEFGGDPSRWSRGYKWLVHYIDDRYYPLIGPNGLRKWAHLFPYFAETLRLYIQRDKDRVNSRGPYVLATEHRYNQDEFNVFSFTDCTVYEVCRPGSGPKASTDDGPTERREDWYIKQRAFYDGYHRGMEACIKILTICLPNGLTAAMYGPSSSRNDDRTMFHLSEFDHFLRDLCLEFHGGDLYCTYGDGTFAGNWYCLRTMHRETTGMPLLEWQEDENMNLKSARVSVEWSYARAEQQWPMLTNKGNYKVDMDPRKCFAEVQVMYLLTNLKVCADEGSTMTGTRGFQCPPPSLEEYLDMLHCNE